MMLQRNVLKLDIAGIPEDWISPRDAAELITKNLVAWSLGDVVKVVHGGHNRLGIRSIIEVPSILAVQGTASIYLPDVPGSPGSPTREKLFKRDRNMCAYCGDVFHPRDLEAEHVLPRSRGGQWSWMNLVASCHECNQVKKKDKTPEEAGMPLLYLPYVPSRWEAMILDGRHILAEQMEFLLASVPKHSRLFQG